MAEPRREVPIEELLAPGELETLGTHGRPPTPRQLQDALPPGWVVSEDGTHARRDLRLLFRRGWMIAIGLVLFGAAAISFFIEVLPGGMRGVLRFGTMILVLAVVGGVAGPIITRALSRR